MTPYFFYQDYEHRDYPAEQLPPDWASREQHVEKHQWLALQAHPIKETIRVFETEYQKYPNTSQYLDPLRRLMLVAYGAHPLFGAHATLRLTGFIRLSLDPEREFEAMALASDTFARYGFAVEEAILCAQHAAECAQLAGKPLPVITAWQNRAEQLHAHRESLSPRPTRPDPIKGV